MKYRKTTKFFEYIGYLTTKPQKALLLLLLIGVQIGCNKYPKRGQSVNKGDIVGNYETECQTTYSAIERTIIIKNVAEFDSVFKEQSCVNTAKNFDFNSFSILGQRVKFKCDSKIIRELKIDHNSKLYIYKVKFKDVGMCARDGSALNLVIVPKIPVDYIVEFNVEED